jgi:hypothetical protein
MRGHDSTLTFILPVADCVAIRQRISVEVSVISTAGRNPSHSFGMTTGYNTVSRGRGKRIALGTSL